MGVVFVPDDNDLSSGLKWRRAFTEYFPDMAYFEWPIYQKESEIRYAIVWNPPSSIWALLPNLDTVFVLGAGVDFVLQQKLPPNVKVVRLLDAGMAKPMATYALFASLFFQRSFDKYQRHQAQKQWRPLDYTSPKKWPIGVMGLGTIGRQVASTLVDNNFPVIGWSRTAKPNLAYDVFSGPGELSQFIADIKILVNVLPLTSSTRGIVNSKLLYQMKPGGYLINIGRGATINEKELSQAISSGHLEGAFLDVFWEEPLPSNSSLYDHPQVVITPHVAAPTVFEEAVNQIMNNIRLIEDKVSPKGLVDRELGY